MATMSANIGINGYQELNQTNLQNAIDTQFGAGKAIVIDNGNGTFTVSFIDSNRDYNITDSGVEKGIQWKEKMAKATQQTINGKTVYAIDSNGNDVDMNYWEYCYDEQTTGYALNDEEVLNNSEYGGTGTTRIRTKGYLGDYTTDGEITVNVPAYIKENDGWKPVTSMYNTFYNCTDLKIAPNIPNTVINMWSTYHNCSNLTEGKVGNCSVNLMNCFINCTNLVNMPRLPSTADYLLQMFQGCSNLKNITTIPNRVTDMGSMFSNCTSLEKMPNIPNSVTNLSNTFSGCTNLKITTKLGDNVRSLNGTFYQCTSLEKAPEIPNNVKIMRSTFNGCTNLKTPPSKIPNSVINMISTFQSCTNLEGNIEINANLNDDTATTTENNLIIGQKCYNNCFVYSSTNGNGLIVSTSNNSLKENDYQLLKNIINTKTNSGKINIE